MGPRGLMMATKVFISYRRDDSKYQARMIHAAFCQVLPRDHVFMDVDTILPGANFRKILKDWVNQCEVLLALIGPGWIDSSDPKSKGLRLDNPSDFVRIEIGEALARDIPVVPVLLDGAPLPDMGLLPDDLKELVDRQAEFVEYRTFDADVERLIRKLRLDQGVDRAKRRRKAEAEKRLCDDDDEHRRTEAEDRRRLDEAEAVRREAKEEAQTQSQQGPQQQIERWLLWCIASAPSGGGDPNWRTYDGW
jgi:TIR domain